MPLYEGVEYTNNELRLAHKLDPRAWEMQPNKFKYYADRKNKRVASLIKARQTLQPIQFVDYSKLEDRIANWFTAYNPTQVNNKPSGRQADFVVMDEFAKVSELLNEHQRTVGTVTGRLSSRGPNFDFNLPKMDVDKERIPPMYNYGNVNTVKVIFNIRDNGTRMTEEEEKFATRYDYITDRDDIEKDDIVVVNVARMGGQLKFVTVVDVLRNIRLGTANKFIVDKVDTKAYLKRVADAQRTVQIRDRLIAIEGEEKERKKFEELAATNSEAKNLLSELDILEGRKSQISTASDTSTEQSQ